MFPDQVTFQVDCKSESFDGLQVVTVIVYCGLLTVFVYMQGI